MKNENLIVKFEQVCDQSNESIRRLSGFVKAKNFIEIINHADLQANPRSSKVGLVTYDIIDSIIKYSSIFPFMTKGVLLASANPPRDLERRRFELQFSEPSIEGILDGGHNTLAIAIHILNIATEKDRSISKIKRWDDLKSVWDANQAKIELIKDQLDFLIPLEILVPATNTEENLETFKNSILDICSARNNNVQLVLDTKANQAGHYDYIKSIIDPVLAKDVVWKTNESGRVPVRDLVALAWIPLSMIELPAHISKSSPVQIYSSKGKCMENFVNLMEDDFVAKQLNGEYELKNTIVGSALDLLKDLPKLYDRIYKNFPRAYNDAGGKFGRISSVKMYDPKKYKEDPKSYLNKKVTTPFYAEEFEYQVPDGFIVPLVCALSALIENKDGKLAWKTDPFKFVERNLSGILKQYKGMMDLSFWNPQTVGKAAPIYAMAKQQFEHFLLTDKMDN
ncbi:MAG: hypothetical protein FD163_19 [Hyphomonadaceae bacterium]|nr:MAG: hypothetical protein FD128_1342 [Hyphomonadaceae bacterium]KAF0186744.1 MAG: hypothetical protein FD163_19 [Hyphomonadaceae bacterium]